MTLFASPMEELFTLEEITTQHMETPASEIACHTGAVRPFNAAEQAGWSRVRRGWFAVATKGIKQDFESQRLML